MKATAHPRTLKHGHKSEAAKPRVRAPRKGNGAGSGAQTATTRSAEERRQRIAEAAYFRAQERGFTPGQEVDDWLAAESQIDGETLLAHQLKHSDT